MQRKTKPLQALYIERYEHVESLLRALRDVRAENPTLFDHPDKLWSMNETTMCTETTKKIKVFGSASRHHSGGRASTGGKMRKQITAIVEISA